jgi:hypothetical protein
MTDSNIDKKEEGNFGSENFKEWLKTCVPLTAIQVKKLALEKEYEHENDRYIYFDEGPHKYYIWDQKEDAPVVDPISITTLIKNYHQEFDDDSVIDINYDKWQAQPENKYYGKSKEQIKQGWKDSNNKSSRQGTQLHKRIELFYNGIDYQTYLKSEDATEDEKRDGKDEKEKNVEWSYFENFHKEIPSKNKWFSFRTEWRIYCPKVGICGTIDKIYIPSMAKPSEIIIYDWKRSKKIDMTNRYKRMASPLQDLEDCNYIHYSLQLNSYKKLLEKCYDVKVIAMFLCICHPDNDDYKTYEISSKYGAHVDKIFAHHEASKKKK